MRANRGKGTVGEWDAERRTQKLSSVSLAVVVLDRLNSFISFLHFHSTTQRHNDMTWCVVCGCWVGWTRCKHYACVYSVNGEL